MVDFHPTRLHAFSNIMEFCINVLASVMQYQILIESDSGFIIHNQLERFQLLPDHLANKATEPDALTRRNCCRDVLCLTGRQRDDLLLLLSPSDHAATNEQYNL